MRGGGLSTINCFVALANLDWRNGAGTCLTTTDGRLGVHDSNFENVGTALDVRKPGLLRVVNSVFTDASDRAVRIREAQAGDNVLCIVAGSTFDDCEVGLSVEDCTAEVRVEGSDFIGNFHTVQTALRAEIVRRLTLTNTEIHGFVAPPVSVNPEEPLLRGAVELTDVPEFHLRGGSDLHHNGVAITVPYTVFGDGNETVRTNIFVRESAINDNRVGIHMVVDPPDNGLDYGLVSMACSELRDNTYGIVGKDLLLEIDANLLAGHGNEPRSNYFQDSPNGLLIEVCLEDRAAEYFDPNDDDYVLMATGNYWGTDNNTVSSHVNSIVRVLSPDAYAGCASHYGDVVVNTDPVAPEPVTGCPSGTPPGGPTPEPSDPELKEKTDCIVMVGEEERLVHQQYAEAWRAVELGQTQLATDLFLPVAALSGSEIEAAYHSNASSTLNYSVESTRNQCRRYRDVARTFVDAEAAANNLRTQRDYTTAEQFDGYWTDAARGEAVIADLQLELAPNPTDDVFFLSTYRDGAAEYVCYDPFGREVQRGDFERSVKVRTHDWRPGVYTVEVRYPNRRPVAQRIVITR